MIKLTPRQRAIWQYLGRYKQNHGYSPTFREISREFNIRLQAVTDNLQSIEKKGFLTYERGKPRTIVLDPRDKHPDVVISKMECNTCIKMQYNGGKNKYECILDSSEIVNLENSCKRWEK